jgi:hypothetical protein
MDLPMFRAAGWWLPGGIALAIVLAMFMRKTGPQGGEATSDFTSRPAFGDAYPKMWDPRRGDTRRFQETPQFHV